MGAQHVPMYKHGRRDISKRRIEVKKKMKKKLYTLQSEELVSLGGSLIR